ncbi:MAG: motility associated factor glycosyltransferase family protein [Idiomarinaceae bacterium]|uniref:motility associated factor glycosyltransferase family protein n=1 Tax=Idiomarina sp. 28-8 TaxID=1260624 RepID=UPI0002E6DDAF|nr:6-hydroxymethylpterin diphosphokinase MptE-like protein [Idiomarina sp. 28-8]NWO02282.1 motility associated factor glycosyltransferase family protein [Idiomarinaceae bacterium]
MQKNIAFQFHSDENTQGKKDEKLSTHIIKQKAKNAEALRRNYPDLYQLFFGYTLEKYSVFINRSDEVNILNFADATTLYGLNAKQQQLGHVDYFLRNKSDFLASRDEHLSEQSSSILVTFGLGLGDWLLPLLQKSNFKHVVVCEPEKDILFSSFITVDWVAILDYCAEQGIQLYLQVGDECEHFSDDVNGLLDATGEQTFYIYRHLSYSFLDGIYKQLIVDKTPFSDVKILPDAYSNAVDQVPLFSLWKAQIVDEGNAPSDNKRFKKNLKALSTRYGNLYEEIKDYQPSKWELVKTSCGGVNLYHKERQAFWYNESAEQDEQAYLEQFENNPGNIKPALGSHGGILKDYIHYQFVRKFVALRKELGFKNMVLPQKIPALMTFCPTLGLSVEKILLNRNVRSGFWVEPNIDFFYWSLHTMDWARVLTKLEEDGSFFFLHIGDDGKKLANDLMDRVNSTAGNYAINGYYYTPFLSSNVKKAVARVLEDIQRILSLSENYDHALFGLSHFRQNLKNGVRILTEEKRNSCLDNGLDVPLFIIGNGPSLDNDIEAIKQVRDQVLVMSCGTTLKALWANGIQPDFHAEVEQHKNSYNIVNVLNDPDYLKGITFVGGSWVYPHTPDLFKVALTTLKEGEGTTRAIRKSVTKHNFVTMKRSFPTVANLAIGFANEMRFKEVYLFGMDLGFVDVNQHHSRHSIFYNNKSGDQLYEVQEQGWEISLVKGNFRPVVRTKFDFKLSLRMVEKTLQQMDAEIYNCSDGAKIEGALPLRSDLLLISSSADEAQKARKVIEECAYGNGDQQEILAEVESHFDAEAIIKDIDELIELLDKPFTAEEEVNDALLKQEQLLVDKYHDGDHFFYSLMISTISYLHSILTHFLYYGETWEEKQEGFVKAQQLALSMLRTCRDDFAEDPMRLDDTDWDLIKKL